MTREIDIFVEGCDKPVGRLTGDEQGALSFRYLPDAEMPLSLALPLEKESFKDSEARAFFDNLLQENASLDDVMARHNVERSDIAGLLYHLGRDCPGTVSCVPAGEGAGKKPGRLDEDYETLSETDLAAIMRSLRDYQRLPAETRDPSPLAGVQGKIAIARLPDGRFALPRHGAGVPTTHILKVPRRGEEALVDHEYHLMRVAREVYNGEVAHVERLEIDGARGLLITRFDRQVENGVVRRIHQEDFCQALGLPKSLKYERNGSGYRCFNTQAVRRILDRTVTPAKARQYFLQMTVLNLALGNTDNHAKNHALIYRGKIPELAPLYDVVPILLDRKVTHEFSFRLGNAGDMETLTRDDLIAFARSIGIGARGKAGEDQVRHIAKEMLAGVAAEIGNFQGGAMKLLGDMVANQVGRISDAFGIEIEIPPRDAFLLKGGGWDGAS